MVGQDKIGWMRLWW